MENNRFINFCHPGLQSSISCSTCCSEGYDETNLLSSDSTKFRRGFMVDRFIKPPVDIVVTFKHSVNLSHIILWPRVGQQKSSRFEISSTFTEESKHAVGHEGKSREMMHSAGCASSTSCERISFCSLSDGDNGVVFYCPRKLKKCDISLFIRDGTNFAQRPFRWCKQSAIANVKTVTIKISRTLGSSIPALGRIEIWGKPGIRNTISEKREQWQLWEQTLEEKNQHINSVSTSEQRSLEADTSTESISTALDLNVPEEFLDALTFQIMSLPMVLPSGKVVDQLTLERHQDSEANWGRPPNDPFTGMPFTSSLHPVLDNALKSRIDHFLVMHQDRQDLRLVPRTLGRAGNSSRMESRPTIFSPISTVNGVVEPLSGKETSCSESRELIPSRTILSDFTSDVSSACDRKEMQLDKKLKITSSVNSNHVFHLRADVPSCSSSTLGQKTVDKAQTKGADHFNKRSCSPEVEILSENVVPSKIAKLSNGFGGSYASFGKLQSGSSLSGLSPETRENKLDDTLDDALKTVLTGLPSFVNVDKYSSTQPKRECCKCDSAENLFTLPCNHLICRTCLLQSIKLAQPKCWSCNGSFTSSQPVKYHH